MLKKIDMEGFLPRVLLPSGVLMINRVSKFWKKPETLSDIRRFFLACEFKPYSKLWSVLEPVAYDVVPAFTHGKLGVLAYDPATYAVLGLDDQDEPLMGYLMTITNPDGILLLDKLKGFYGKDSFNTHVRTLGHVFTEPGKVTTAWCYVLSPTVLNMYQQIEWIEWGMWEQDKHQLELLEKLTEPGN
jgi:hypothetical protein